MLGAEGMQEFISGVILHEETLYQKNDKGEPFPQALKRMGVIPGIKTDKGLVDAVSGAPGEQCTQGLDDYEKRAKKYYAAGARFCKWRKTCTRSRTGRCRTTSSTTTPRPLPSTHSCRSATGSRRSWSRR
eukprot:Sspe_Gene.34::Locus_11_Transcript_1_1_Confidence_1.000_Length_1200::g.34::m.34/K01623/ALDO; fructose-bisphosphate aldolase, class I